MKIKFTIAMLLILGFACSQNEKVQSENQKLTDIEKIAQAYGMEKFEDINYLQYTFNVERDSIILVSRTWKWNRRSGEIIAINSEDTVSFHQDALTDELKKLDHRFINDKYWLLFPYQLIWDTNMTYTNEGLQTAPISGDQLIKLTIQYANDVGYTPGDAYDLYLDENWIIREWEFRKSGKERPGSMVTWEGYTDLNGVLLATNHVNKDGSFRLFFTDIKFE